MRLPLTGFTPLIAVGFRKPWMVSQDKVGSRKEKQKRLVSISAGHVEGTNVSICNVHTSFQLLLHHLLSSQEGCVCRTEYDNTSGIHKYLLGIQYYLYSHYEAVLCAFGSSCE